MNIIELGEVNKYFGVGENRVHVLKNISFTVAEGDFVAIMGQSGSGKSTLMNIIGCLDVQSSGVCRIAGQDTQHLTPDELASLRGRVLGFIFQRYNLLPALSAQENTALPAVYAGVSSAKRKERAEEILTHLDLGERLNYHPAELSGGQQQRVSIARALMNGGRLILADEPTGALDSQSGEMVMGILGELNRQGHTIVMVTHDHAIAKRASRIIEIHDGVIQRDTRSRALKTEEVNGEQKNARATAKGSRLHARLDQFGEAFSMSLHAILAHKLRSILTMLGIIIGIASVVSVVALGTGSQQQIIADISSLGTNTIDIYPGKTFGDRFSGRYKTLTVADADILGKQPYVDSVTPNTSDSEDMVYQSQTVTAQINGVGEQYFTVKAQKLAQGRFFNRDEVRTLASYLVIDDNSYQQLFPKGGNAVGKVVFFKRQPLTIIGVLKKEERSFGPGSDRLRAYAPYTTVMKKISGEKYITSITVKISKNVLPIMAEKQLTQLLTARHGKKDFFTVNTDSIRQTIESTTNTMKMLISGIAVISLVVGGIGVMNIMLVSVTERTREIGVRMAVGARRINIMEQFLIEAVLICIVGGLLGVGLSRLIGFVFGLFVSNFPMAYSHGAMAAALACSSLIGIIFGFIPARNASLLNPIEALSRE